MTKNSTISKEVMTKYYADIAAIVSAEPTVLNINTQSEYDSASKFIRQIKDLADEMNEKRISIKAPYQSMADEVDAWFMPKIKMLVSKNGTKTESAEARIKSAMIRYQEIQEAKARELQRQADEKARKEREEIERKAREKREKEEALRRQAEAADNAKEKEKLLAKAEAAAEKADEIEEQAEMIVAPVFQAPKQKNDTITWKYYGEVIDITEFIKYCIESNFLFLLEINQKEVDCLISRYRGEIKIPGIVIKKKPCMRIS